MTNAYSVDDVLEFLDQSAARGLMPTATAQALAAASRNVLGVLSNAEKADLSGIDIDVVFKRFANRRAADFNPSSLKAYDQRVRRAIELFLDWREDPSNFTVKTRAPRGADKRHSEAAVSNASAQVPSAETGSSKVDGTYQSSFPVRSGVVVTLLNIPYDLTASEAERLARFVGMLAIE